MSQEQVYEGAISGAIAGAITGAIVSKLMQQKIPTQPTQPPQISIIRQIYYKVPISGSQTIVSLEANLILVLIYGDGDSSVTLTVTMDDSGTVIYGDDQAVGLASKLEITASGSGYSPTIEVAYIKIT